MRLRNGLLRVVLPVFLFASLAGCFGGAERPELGYVSGKVIRDGQPVENITIVMKPDVGRAGPDVGALRAAAETLRDQVAYLA